MNRIIFSDPKTEYTRLYEPEPGYTPSPYSPYTTTPGYTPSGNKPESTSKPSLYAKPIKEEESEENIHPLKVLGWMIRSSKKINLSEAVKIIKGITIQDLQGLIYELVTDGKVDGIFEGENFIIQSEIDEFIDAFDEIYETWNSRK